MNYKRFSKVKNTNWALRSPKFPLEGPVGTELEEGVAVGGDLVVGGGLVVGGFVALQSMKSQMLNRSLGIAEKAIARQDKSIRDVFMSLSQNYLNFEVSEFCLRPLKS